MGVFERLYESRTLLSWWHTNMTSPLMLIASFMSATERSNATKRSSNLRIKGSRQEEVAWLYSANRKRFCTS